MDTTLQWWLGWCLGKSMMIKREHGMPSSHIDIQASFLCGHHYHHDCSYQRLGKISNQLLQLFRNNKLEGITEDQIPAENLAPSFPPKNTFSTPSQTILWQRDGCSCGLASWWLHPSKALRRLAAVDYSICHVFLQLVLRFETFTTIG